MMIAFCFSALGLFRVFHLSRFHSSSPSTPLASVSVSRFFVSKPPLMYTHTNILIVVSRIRTRTMPARRKLLYRTSTCTYKQ